MRNLRTFLTCTVRLMVAAALVAAFQVTAAAPDGAGATTVVAPPSGVTAFGSKVRVTLAWNPVPGATGYQVGRSLAPGGPYDVVATATAKSYVDEAVTADTAYYYVLQTVTSSELSAFSRQVSAITATAANAPVNINSLSVTGAPGRVSLSWNPIQGATGYIVLRSTDDSGPFTPVASPSTAALNDVGLAPSTTYFYVVRAVSVKGTSGSSRQKSAVTASGPSAPTSPKGVSAAGAARAVNLAWNPVDVATGYEVLRSDTDGGPYVPVGSPTVPSYNDTGLEPDRSYFYLVRAVAVDGTSGSSRQMSAITATSGTAVAPPKGVTATGEPGQVVVNWGAVVGAGKYAVLRSVTPGGPYAEVAKPLTNTYTDAAVVTTATYYYVVRAVSPKGTSGTSRDAHAQPM